MERNEESGVTLKTKSIGELQAEQSRIQAEMREHELILPGLPKAARKAVEELLDKLAVTNSDFARELQARHRDERSQRARRIERNSSRVFKLLDGCSHDFASDADASEIMQLLNQLRTDGCTPGRNYEAVKNTIAMLQRVPLPPYLRTLKWNVFRGWVKLPTETVAA
jgi:hypothetical protein